jgi:hypothetical protein
MKKSRLLGILIGLLTTINVLADNDVMITRDGAMIEVKIERISASQVTFVDLKHKRKGSQNAPSDFVYMIMKEKGNNIFFDEEGNQSTSPVVKFEKKDNVMFLNRGEMLVVYNVSVGKDEISYQQKDKKKAPWIKVPKSEVFMIINSDGTRTLYNDSYQERQKKQKQEQQRLQEEERQRQQQLLQQQRQLQQQQSSSVPATSQQQTNTSDSSNQQLLASGTANTDFTPVPSMASSDIEMAVNVKNPYTLYRKGSVAEYCFQYKGKQSQYMGGPTYVQQIVADEKIENGLLVSYIKQAFFNKKHEPSKGVSGSYKDYLFPTEIDTSGTYHLTHNIMQDFIFVTKRSGYGILVPGDMKPGMKLKCSTLHDNTKNGFGATIKLETVYSDWQVVGEQQITTPAGTFDCVKLTGRIAQKNNSILPNSGEQITCWMARGIGIVQYETISDSDKKREPYILYLNKLELK